MSISVAITPWCQRSWNKNYGITALTCMDNIIENVHYETLRSTWITNMITLYYALLSSLLYFLIWSHWYGNSPRSSSASSNKCNYQRERERRKKNRERIKSRKIDRWNEKENKTERDKERDSVPLYLCTCIGIYSVHKRECILRKRFSFSLSSSVRVIGKSIVPTLLPPSFHLPPPSPTWKAQT